VPANNATDVLVDQILTWDCSDPDGDPLVYDVWFGPPLSMIRVSEGQTQTQYDPAGMLGDMDYEWRVVARDDGGRETEGPFWSFTTMNEVYAELQLLRTITYDYGVLTIGDMIKARFDRSYAPDGGITPLRPGGVTCGSYTLYWLDYEEIYFYLDSGGGQLFTPGTGYLFTVTPGGGVDQTLTVTATMPACDAYITSPENATGVSLNDGFAVFWTSTCPDAGTVDLYVRNGMGEDIGIHVNTSNDGYHFFSSSVLAPAAGSFEIFVDLIAEEEETIDATGYNRRSVWRSQSSCTRRLYVM
jgi:hypothetical protein